MTASKGAGRQAIQDEILKVLSLEAGEGMPARTRRRGMTAA